MPSILMLTACQSVALRQKVRVGLNSEFQAFLDAVDVAQDERMVSQATKSFATSIGYESFAYLRTEGFDIKTINTYPQPWATTYLQHRFSIIDPVVIEA